MEHTTLVVVIPIGPTCNPAFVRDTVESVVAYTTPNRRILLVDDSQRGTGQSAAEGISDTEVLHARGSQGKGGGLYKNLCLAYAHAVAHYRFEALLRLDTDALVVGPHPEHVIIKHFQANPRLAMGGEIYRDNESVRAVYEAAADPAAYRARLAAVLRRPWSRYRWGRVRQERVLAALYRRAVANGYQSIDYVFGGCYAMGEGFLRILASQGMLPHPQLGGLGLEEDHIFGLLASVVGMEIEDMHTGSLPFGTAWKGLPASPADLMAQGKGIVHSTRRWQDLDEAAIRAEFRARREAYLSAPRAR